MSINVTGTMRGENSAGGTLKVELAGNGDDEVALLITTRDETAYIRVDVDVFLRTAEAIRAAVGRGR